MRDVDLNESCSCGATFRFASIGTFAVADANKAVREWRTGHKHEARTERPIRKRIPMAPRSAR